jgi:hypothetical protein
VKGEKELGHSECPNFEEIGMYRRVTYNNKIKEEKIITTKATNLLPVKQALQM